MTTPCHRAVRAGASSPRRIARPYSDPTCRKSCGATDVDAAKTRARTTSQDGKHTWEVPLAPFLGCLGVAPAMAEVRSTIVPGPFGGNMDCWEVRAGNTVFLGVNVSGALFSIGDGHYAMGEGEIMGAAIEGAMNVELYVEVLKGQATPVPRIENADEVMFVGSGPAARGRRTCRVQSDGPLGAAPGRHERARRLSVRRTELARAYRPARRSRVHGAGETGKGAP